MNTGNINPIMGDIIKAHSEPVKELQEPQMIRIKPSLKAKIQTSADKHNEGNFNREVRDLIQIGLKNRKRGEK
jgi:hypothetical protein